MTSTPTILDTETELSAVNSILGAIGQSPVTTLGSVTNNSGDEITNTYENPEVAFIYNIFKESCRDVQNEGWHFNKEYHVAFNPDGDGFITIPNNVLRLDVTDGYRDRYKDVVKRDGKLYDKTNHSNVFDGELLCDVVYLFSYTDIPSVFQRYIVYKASTRAATQLIANTNLAQLLSQQETLARSSCLEYECNQGNHTMFGFPEESVSNTYQPWTMLRRS
jgi:hypothetical protein